MDFWPLLNEVLNVCVAQLVQDLTAVKIERSKKTSVLVLKRMFFSIIQIWRLVFSKPVGVQRHYVPHLNGLIMLYLNFEAQERDSTFTFHRVLLKKAILEGKRAAIRRLMSMCAWVRREQNSQLPFICSGWNLRSRPVENNWLDRIGFEIFGYAFNPKYNFNPW